MLQVKIKLIQVNIFQPRLILYFLLFLALIIHELGPGQKRYWESTKVKIFNLNLILTCET